MPVLHSVTPTESQDLTTPFSPACLPTICRPRSALPERFGRLLTPTTSCYCEKFYTYLHCPTTAVPSAFVQGTLVSFYTTAGCLHTYPQHSHCDLPSRTLPSPLPTYLHLPGKFHTATAFLGLPPAGFPARCTVHGAFPSLLRWTAGSSRCGSLFHAGPTCAIVHHALLDSLPLHRAAYLYMQLRFFSPALFTIRGLLPLPLPLPGHRTEDLQPAAGPLPACSPAAHSTVAIICRITFCPSTCHGCACLLGTDFTLPARSRACTTHRLLHCGLLHTHWAFTCLHLPTEDCWDPCLCLPLPGVGLPPLPLLLPSTTAQA